MPTQPIQIPFHRRDAHLAYTPTRFITAKEDDGTFDLVVKTYFPDQRHPAGLWVTSSIECWLARRLGDKGVKMYLRVIDANKSQNDMIVKD